MANLLVPTEIGLAGSVAPLEGEHADCIAAVRCLVGLDMAIQMGDVAHLVMADGGIAPAGIGQVGGGGREIAPEAVRLRVACTGMGVCFAEDDLLRRRGHLLDRIGDFTAHDVPIGTVGAVVVPVGAGRRGRAEERLGIQVAACAGSRVARPSLEGGIGCLHHDFVPERMLHRCAVGVFIARGAAVRGRQIALVVARVHGHACAELLHVADAVDGIGLVARFREGGEEHGGENRDDGDDDQQLDQREMTVFFHVLFPLWLMV